MDNYLNYIKDIKENGVFKEDRTGVGTYSVAGRTMRFDLAKGFPVLTTKKLYLRAIIHELLWFISGDSNVQYLQDNKVKIWDDWLQPWNKDRELVLVTPKHKNFVDYKGDFDTSSVEIENETDKKLSVLWERIMRQCYDKDYQLYSQFGKEGTNVCSRWHNLANFISDVKKLPHWRYKLMNWENFSLTSYYYQSQQYSPDTCVWWPIDEPVDPQVQGVIVESPEGKEYFYQTDKEEKTLSDELVLDHIEEIASNKRKDWNVSKIKDSKKLVRRVLIDDKDLGPVYGKQWRYWPSAKNPGQFIDQIQTAIDLLKNNPTTRRNLVVAWNPDEVKGMALPPCHALFQFIVLDGKLSCTLYQRSADSFLGVPFNIASYSLLTHMMAQQANLDVGEFIWFGGDCHIYSNHMNQIEKQLSRKPRELPTLKINRKPESIFDYKFEDFELEGYDPHPSIKAPIAV